MEVTDFAVVDLFCGVGGLTHGFVRRNFPVAAGIDFDATCKYAYEVNNDSEFLHRDIKEITAEEVIALYPHGHRKILVGCAPCQPFSSYTATRHKAKDEWHEKRQWSLLDHFGRLVRDIRPDIVSMENVPQLKSFGDGEVFDNFVGTLTELGYEVWYDVVKAYEYGVPQSRRRLVLIASLVGRIELIPGPNRAGDYVTLRDAIWNLPPIEDGESHPDDPLHRARKLSALNKRRIRATPEGGSWLDWHEDLILDCHKKKTGKTYKSVYGRMKWDGIGSTMTTQCTGLGNGRFGHPDQDRAISLREAAIIQSFPPRYQFFDPNTKLVPTWVERHIGNAVPVGLAEAIALSIENHIHTL